MFIDWNCLKVIMSNVAHGSLGFCTFNMILLVSYFPLVDLSSHTGVFVDDVKIIIILLVVDSSDYWC